MKVEITTPNGFKQLSLTNEGIVVLNMEPQFRLINTFVSAYSYSLKRSGMVNETFEFTHLYAHLVAGGTNLNLLLLFDWGNVIDKNMGIVGPGYRMWLSDYVETLEVVENDA